MNPALSIVIAAHREGLIAHKTMLSVQRGVEHLKRAGHSYEIIVTIDNGDRETLDYFNRYATSSDIAVHSVSFGDLAMSRNYGVSLAKGSIIATLDADDLVSENWFSEGASLLKTLDNQVVLHTHYSINFGTQDIIWEKFDSRSKQEDAVIMTWANRWDSAIIAPREIFERFPYQPNTEGYGSEDWHFNSQTLAADISHKVVPHTILYVRRKDVSQMTIQAADRRTVRYTELLDFDFLRAIDIKPYLNSDNISPDQAPSLLNHAATIAKKGARRIHHTAKVSPLYVASTKKLIATLKEQRQSSKMPRFPDWLVAEWRAIHTIDKSIFPDEYLVETVPLYHSEMHELGVLLCRLANHLNKQPNYMVFVPTMTKGGAELVTIHHLEALKQVHPDWNLAVIATEQGDHPWKDRLPIGVDFIPYGDITHHLPEQLRLQLLARFIVQSKAERLHIAQSPLMFRFVSLYQTLLKPYHVSAFAFCEDTDNQGRIAGHIHSGLPYAYNSIDKIITDNASLIPQLVDEYGFAADKFITHYQPVEVTLTPPQNSSSNKLHLLWASRIAKQKRPDILIEIAQKLKDSDITIDVYGSFQDGYSKSIFNNVPNIKYKGQFNGVNNLPTSQYDAFLYTSENDGIPNILLEITAKGLPIVAPKVGGVAEFITTDTGMLIENPEDIDSYLAALHELADRPDKRYGLASSAQKKLQVQHSWQQFISAVRRDII